MKTNFVSSYAVSSALRHRLMQMQTDLVKAQKEATTGAVADTGLALGSRTGKLVSLQREVDSLQGMIVSNGLVSGRLNATQEALNRLRTVAEDFASTLTAGISSNSDVTVATTAANGVLETMTAILNNSLNGEYLFAGIDTDIPPFKDFTTAVPATFDTAFQSHFGFAQDDPQAVNITGADMETFLSTVIEPSFLDDSSPAPNWKTEWSNASDQKVVNRISLSERVESSTNANSEGVRRLAMAAASASALLTETMSVEAKAAVLNNALSQVGAAIGRITSEQTQFGIAQNRIKSANDRLEAQKDLFQRSALDLKGVDVAEAATRVSTLLTQIETSYALTARIQNLSILNYLT